VQPDEAATYEFLQQGLPELQDMAYTIRTPSSRRLSGAPAILPPA